jgi:hypothetical protein
MLEPNLPIAALKTPQELERAIQNYRRSNLTGPELFRQWQAIRDAALELSNPETKSDRVPGEDSY